YLAADPEAVLELAPGVAARLTASRNRVKLPEPLSGRRIVCADEAGLLAVAVAPAEPLQDLAVDHHRPTRVLVTLRALGDDRFPPELSGPRVERHQARVGRREEDLVLVDGEVPHRGVADRSLRADVVLPDKGTRLRVQRLQDVQRVGKVDD